MALPKRLEDLSGHRLVCQHAGSPQVLAGASLVQELLTYDMPSTLTVNNYFGVLQAVLSNLGIGVLPDYLTEDFPTLVRVLPETESNEVPVFLAYPGRTASIETCHRLPRFRDRRGYRAQEKAERRNASLNCVAAMQLWKSRFALLSGSFA